MPSYKAPIRDMQFLLKEVFPLAKLCQELPAYQEVDMDLIDPILEEAGKFNENILHPLNQIGDAEGLQFKDGIVTTPTGFKEAYQQFVEAGWLSLNADPNYGGQGLPKVLQVFMNEMLASSNVSFSLYTVLTEGAYHALHLHATEDLKNQYLPKLITGEWSGTMCLTEPHCGTDLGLLRTKAEPAADSSYRISGTKIFITSGEHDLADNIIHTVLARLPDAPPGIKGISLFLVPKILVNKDGSLGERNHLACGSIEHKMGIKASATCVMNFDGAIGYLIGEKHQGMRAMFSMMNLERLNIGLEGLALSEIAYQNALNYAKDRLQGRAATGAIEPNKPADPIIVHPDVRRMLLTCKAYNEAARAAACYASFAIDRSEHHPDEQVQAQQEQLVAFLTPIIKAFFTDYGFDACNLALQVLGGHGYVREWGMEQFVRDARIAQIYEGANGIQALDLVKRKLIMNEGDSLEIYLNEVKTMINTAEKITGLQDFITRLNHATEVLQKASNFILSHQHNNVNLAGSASVDYLKIAGLHLLAFMWLQMVITSKQTNEQEQTFYESKLLTANFFYQKVLPQVDSLLTTLMAGADVLMDFEVRHF